jgi:hypothetical protein
LFNYNQKIVFLGFSVFCKIMFIALFQNLKKKFLH